MKERLGPWRCLILIIISLLPDLERELFTRNNEGIHVEVVCSCSALSGV